MSTNNLHKIDDDLKYAVEFNGGLDLNEVLGIRACIYGENDESDWYWIIKMKDGTWGLGQGGCDYTGWDCQSNFSFKPTKTMHEAVNLTPEKEELGGRYIQRCLKKQLSGRQPFGSIDKVDYA